MTPEQFVTELEQIFDKRLKPEQTPLYVGKVRRFSPEQRVEILNKVLEEAKYFPKVSEIFKAAELLGFLAIDHTKTPFHRWKETDCSYCHGEGRLAVIWDVAFRDTGTGRLEIQTMAKMFQYTKSFDHILVGNQFRTVFRCKCLAGDVDTIPKIFPKLTRDTPNIREIWV